MLAVGDFNGDGHQDVAVAASKCVLGEYASIISVLLGKGNGTFQLAKDTDVLDCATSVAVGDFNRDGQQDLAVGLSGGVSILLAVANGTF